MANLHARLRRLHLEVALGFASHRHTVQGDGGIIGIDCTQ